MSCQTCHKELIETSLKDALELTRQKAFQSRIAGGESHELPDAYKQYHIRSYLKDRSLFLDYDIYKNRLKHGRAPKRFFIAPVNLTCLFNLPWFFFNVFSSNLFHMEYTAFCERCNSKYNPKHHSPEECDYNIEYFHVLDDILSGDIVSRHAFYRHFAEEKMKAGHKSAYHDLFHRPVRTEIFLDLLSIGFSIGLWLYLAVNVSWPMFQVLLQQVSQLDAYELSL